MTRLYQARLHAPAVLGADAPAGCQQVLPADVGGGERAVEHEEGSEGKVCGLLDNPPVQ